MLVCVVGSQDEIRDEYEQLHPHFINSSPSRHQKPELQTTVELEPPKKEQKRWSFIGIHLGREKQGKKGVSINETMLTSPLSKARGSGPLHLLQIGSPRSVIDRPRSESTITPQSSGILPQGVFEINPVSPVPLTVLPSTIESQPESYITTAPGRLDESVRISEQGGALEQVSLVRRASRTALPVPSPSEADTPSAIGLFSRQRTRRRTLIEEDNRAMLGRLRLFNR